MVKTILVSVVVLISLSCASFSVQEKHDRYLYERGMAVVISDSSTEMDRVSAYYDFKEIKGDKYKSKVIGYLLLCAAYYGEYEEGRSLCSLYMDRSMQGQISTLARVMFPTTYSLMEFADNNDVDSFNEGIWSMINYLRQQYEETSDSEYLFDVESVVAFFDGEEREFASRIRGLLFDKNFDCIPSYIVSQTYYMFSPAWIQAKVAPMREALKKTESNKITPAYENH